jgi:(2Fe-2S) ferredoxin
MADDSTPNSAPRFVPGTFEPGAVPFERHVLLCNGGTCSKMWDVEAIKLRLRELQRTQRVMGTRLRVTTAACHAMCEKAPNIVVWPEGVAYSFCGEDDLLPLMQTHFATGEIDVVRATRTSRSPRT